MSRPGTAGSKASRSSAGSRGSRTRAEWDVDKHVGKLTGERVQKEAKDLQRAPLHPWVSCCATDLPFFAQTPIHSIDPRAAVTWSKWGSATS